MLSGYIDNNYYTYYSLLRILLVKRRRICRFLSFYEINAVSGAPGAAGQEPFFWSRGFYDRQIQNIPGAQPHTRRYGGAGRSKFCDLVSAGH
jgi:hypothetical protein